MRQWGKLRCRVCSWGSGASASARESRLASCLRGEGGQRGGWGRCREAGGACAGREGGHVQVGRGGQWEVRTAGGGREA